MSKETPKAKSTLPKSSNYKGLGGKFRKFTTFISNYLSDNNATVEATDNSNVKKSLAQTTINDNNATFNKTKIPMKATSSAKSTNKVSPASKVSPARKVSPAKKVSPASAKKTVKATTATAKTSDKVAHKEKTKSVSSATKNKSKSPAKTTVIANKEKATPKKAPSKKTSSKADVNDTKVEAKKPTTKKIKVKINATTGKKPDKGTIANKAKKVVTKKRIAPKKSITAKTTNKTTNKKIETPPSDVAPIGVTHTQIKPTGKTTGKGKRIIASKKTTAPDSVSKSERTLPKNPSTKPLIPAAIDKKISRRGERKSSIPAMPTMDTSSVSKGLMSFISPITAFSNKGPRFGENRTVSASSKVIPLDEKIQVKKYLSKKDLNNLRKIMMEQRKRLLQGLDNAVQELQEEMVSVADPNDRASQETDLALELRERDRETRLIHKIDETLKRMDHKNYGYCDECGVEVGLSRLQARPMATLCIDCKELQEFKEKQTLT